MKVAPVRVCGVLSGAMLSLAHRRKNYSRTACDGDSIGGGTQAHGMTASEPPRHGHQGTKVSPAQSRAERQERDRAYQEHRR
jgi:hypothetical protein